MSFVHRSVAGDVCGRDLVRQPLPSRLVHVGATADVLLEFAIDIVTPGLQRVEPRFDALDGLPMVLDAGDPQAQVVGHRNQSDSLFRLCSHHLCLCCNQSVTAPRAPACAAGSRRLRTASQLRQRVNRSCSDLRAVCCCCSVSRPARRSSSPRPPPSPPPTTIVRNRCCRSRESRGTGVDRRHRRFRVLVRRCFELGLSLPVAVPFNHDNLGVVGGDRSTRPRRRRWERWCPSA